MNKLIGYFHDKPVYEDSKVIDFKEQENGCAD